MFFNHTAWGRRAAGLLVAFMGLILAALLLATCTGVQPGAAQVVLPIQASAEPIVAPTQAPAEAQAGVAREAPAGNLTQSAQAGAVTVEITPLNLGEIEASTLDFEVAMNTHSVELDMDLAELAVLKAGDTEVAASAWQTPGGGGHHVAGTLIFPRASAAGLSILEGAIRFSVVIRNLAGVPDRTFTWDLDRTGAAPDGGQG